MTQNYGQDCGGDWQRSDKLFASNKKRSLCLIEEETFTQNALSPNRYGKPSPRETRGSDNNKDDGNL